MIRTIAACELRRLFTSPIAWVTLAILQFLFAYQFLSRIELFLQYLPRLRNLESAPGITDFVSSGIFATAGLIFLIIIPLFTARTLAEEKHTGTLDLMLSSPVSRTQIVLGKFFGLLLFFMLLIGLISGMVFSLLIAGPVEFNQVLGSVLGLLLLTSSCLAISLFISSLSAQTLLAAMGAFALLFFLWVIQWGQGALFQYLSLATHFDQMITGLISSVDVIYFLLLTIVFLCLTVWRLDLDRL